MANQREASIKVTLKRGAFSSGMRSMLEESRVIGGRMGRALSGPMKAGFASASKTIRDMGSRVKDVISLAGTLGGAVSFGALVKGAIDGEVRVARLGAQLSMYTGRTVSAARAQGILDRAVERSKTSYTEAATGLAELSSVAGLLGEEGLEDALARSALQAQRLGVAGNVTAKTYSRLLSRGIANSAEEAERLVEQMSKFGRVELGLSADEAIDPSDAAEFASFTKQAGLDMNKSLTLMKLAGGESVKDFGQASEFVEEFGNVFRDVKSLGDLRKDLGLSPDAINTSKDGLENMLTVLESSGSKGVKAMLAGFGNERTKASLRKLIGEDLVVDIETGKKGTGERLKLRAEELRRQFAVAGESAEDLSRDIERQNKALTSTSAAEFQSAMNTLEKSFQKPEMIAAINSLAKSLPKLADAAAKLMTFAVQNPGTAAAGLVGGKVALSFAGGAITDAARNFGSGAGKEIAAQGPSIGKSIGKNISVPAAGGASGFPAAASALAATGGIVLAGDQASKLQRETGSTTSMLDALPGFKKGKFDSDEMMKNLVASLTLGAVGGVEHTIAGKVGTTVGRAGRDIATHEERANALAKVRAGTGQLDRMMAQAMNPSATTTGAPADTEAAGEELQAGGKAVQKGGDALTGAAKELTAAARAMPKATGGSGTGASKGPMPTGGGRGSGAVPRPG